MIRRAVIDDIDSIMLIYEDARKYMRENNNMSQWINGYPDRNLILNDISLGHSYVYELQGEIAGVFTYYIGKEKSYNSIRGNWTKNDRYGVIHRIAIGRRSKNIGTLCLEYCINDCKYLRIDTHEDNGPMRRFLKKNGFKECGIIVIDDGSERIAYDKSI